MIDFNNEKIMEKVKEIPFYGDYDVVIAGGGVAGFGAAIAVGKRGYKVLLIEATSALGGLATMGLVNIPLDFVSGIGREMMDELEAIEGHWHRNTNVEKHKLVLDNTESTFFSKYVFGIGGVVALGDVVYLLFDDSFANLNSFFYLLVRLLFLLEEHIFT